MHNCWMTINAASTHYMFNRLLLPLSPSLSPLFNTSTDDSSSQVQQMIVQKKFAVVCTRDGKVREPVSVNMGR